ncbi:MAG: hypothetical protein JXB50_08730 [Spirochaetes bacterium]|nr:hypothetical protein [Spirochaetota bacterium]
MFKNKFLLVVISAALFSYCWLTDLYFDLKEAGYIDNLLINVEVDDSAFEKLNIYRISPKNNIDNLLKDDINKSFISMQKGYISKIILSIPEDKIRLMQNIKIIFGSKKFEYSNNEIIKWEKSLKQDDIIELYFPDEVKSNISKIKHFNNIINWQGDLKIFFKSFFYTLFLFIFFLILFAVIYKILKSAIPKEVSVDFEKETDNKKVKNLIKNYYEKKSAQKIALKKDLTLIDNIKLFSLIENNYTYKTLFILLFFTVIIFGLVQRFILTQLPYLTGDVWGYIGTSVIKYDTGQFVHVAGRSFLYPGFVYLILALFKDFAYISIIQHLLGAVTSLLLFFVFRNLIRFFYKDIGIVTIDFLSLLIMTIYSSSQAVIMLEHYILRESIYPFLIIIQLFFFVMTLMNIFKKNEKSSIVFLILFFMNNFLIFFYQPRWTLTFIFNLIIYIVFLYILKINSIKKIILVFLLPLIFSMVLLYVPEKILFKNETATESFLSAHLLFGHARIADIEFEKDINDPDFIKYDKEILIELRKYFNDVFSKKGLKYIGYNVNKLIYGEANSFLKSRFTSSDYKNFCKYYFFRSVFKHPFLYSKKVIKEMSLFYNFKGTMYSDRVYGRDDSLWEYSYTRLPSYKSDYVPYLNYKNALYNYKKSYYDIKKITLPFEKCILLFLSLTFLISLLLFFVLFIINVFMFIKKKPDFPDISFGLTVLIFYLFNFFINLTTSMIYSLDVNRYIDDQILLVLISQFLSFIYIFHFFKRIINKNKIKN